MAKELSHIFLHERQKTEEFTSPRRGAQKSTIPQRITQSHSQKLKNQWQTIWERAKKQEESRSAVSMPTKDGVYIEFEGAPGFDLVTKSLEDRRAGIRLLNVYTVFSEGEPALETIRATLFIPSGKQDHFLKKINEFANEKTKKGNPKNAPLLQSVEDIRLAVLESFWRDDLGLLPQEAKASWCEIWLQGASVEVEKRFRVMAESLDIEVQARSLRFPDRTVLLGKSTQEQLANLIESSPDIAEFRRAKETARFFLELENKEQTEWVNELRSRLRVNPDPSVAVCILDTGVNNGHVLLQPVLADADCHAVEPNWGVNDHHINGHGTLMSGLAAFGDLAVSLQSRHTIWVNHCLESTKILPPRGVNEPDLYGDVTIQGLARAEIQAPERSHIACMAVTSEDGRDFGRPSSWSAALDKLTSGYDDETKRLFVVSAGNMIGSESWADYPESNLNQSIQDPGQSWNALTVGAYTEKDVLSADFREQIPLAHRGELSPFSPTSLMWDTKWPIKPDIVMEGGNLAKGADGLISEYDDLALLSTGHKLASPHFFRVFTRRTPFRGQPGAF